MLAAIKKYVPLSVKKKYRQLRPYLKKELHYLETHLTDHCNLNCKGCGHFAALAPERYADIHQYEKDMRRLSQLFRNIHTIRLMGGEALLHPDPASFITTTRYWFPKSNIRFVTNGILLPKASTIFWDACKKADVTIDISLYPPLRDRLEGWIRICKTNQVNISWVKEVDNFFAHLNLNGTSDKQQALHNCRKKFFCPFLMEGVLYPCAMPATVHYFNSAFDCNITISRGSDIHSPDVSAYTILRQINRPIETCRWCSYDFVEFPWTISKRQLDEWDADYARAAVVDRSHV